MQFKKTDGSPNNPSNAPKGKKAQLTQKIKKTFQKLNSNFSTFIPLLRQSRTLQILLALSVLLFFLLCLLLFYRRPLDPQIVYTDRLNRADDALTIINNINELTSPEGDVEAQINQDDYDTYLAIENDKNRQALAGEYGESISVGEKIQEIITSHEQSIAERGGITSVEDMIALDTLPIKDPQTRAVMLKNMGVSEQEYVRLKNDIQSKQHTHQPTPSESLQADLADLDTVSSTPTAHLHDLHE